MKPIIIKKSDIKVRRTFGKVRPCTLRFPDQKKAESKKACRGKLVLKETV